MTISFKYINFRTNKCENQKKIPDAIVITATAESVGSWSNVVYGTVLKLRVDQCPIF